jgi:hypothetical protein
MNRRDAETQSFRALAEKVIGACIDLHRHLGPGRLINFNVPVLKNGIKRVANNFFDSSASLRLCGELKEFRR